MEENNCQHKCKHIKGFIIKTEWCPERKRMKIISKVKCTKCGKTWIGVAYQTDELKYE